MNVQEVQTALMANGEKIREHKHLIENCNG